MNIYCPLVIIDYEREHKLEGKGTKIEWEKQKKEPSWDQWRITWRKEEKQHQR